MDAKINGISHIWTSIIVTDWLCSQHTVRVNDFLVVIPKKYGSQYVHLLHNHLQTKAYGKNKLYQQESRVNDSKYFVEVTEIYLDTVNFTTITHIKRMHNKKKDDCFKSRLAGVTEHEGQYNNLGAHKD